MRKRRERRNRGIVGKCLVLMFQSDPVLGVSPVLVVNLLMTQRVLVINTHRYPPPLATHLRINRRLHCLGPYPHLSLATPVSADPSPP